MATYVYVGCCRRTRVIAEGGFLGRCSCEHAELGNHGIRIIGTKY